jgi:hypothetical protein
VHRIKRSIAPKFQQKKPERTPSRCLAPFGPALTSAKAPCQWAARAITACWIGIANRLFIDGDILCAARRAIG